ncbi:MAG TPA: hypothetical protein VGQ00_04425 [Candidatus Norongarragalinales archaeon]|jgi:hypothetical protein|nr:hypothetical protein [Candidatus Norongarragalinales archaeon]
MNQNSAGFVLAALLASSLLVAGCAGASTGVSTQGSLSGQASSIDGDLASTQEEFSSIDQELSSADQEPIDSSGLG